MNKLSDKNYLDVLADLRRALQTHVDDAVAHVAFDIASSNLFFAKLYAALFSELCREFPALKTVAEQRLAHFVVDPVAPVDPDVDYDAFCRATALTQKRRAAATFFVHLADRGTVPAAAVCRLSYAALAHLDAAARQPNRRHDVDDAVALLGILFRPEWCRATPSADVPDPVAAIERFTRPDPSLPSLTAKARFACADLLAAAAAS